MHHKQVGRDGRIAIFLKLFCYYYYYYFIIIIIINSIITESEN